MLTILTFDTGKAIMQDAAIKIAINDLSDIGPKKAILLGKAFIIDLLKRLEMVFNALVISRILWFARTIYRRCAEHDLCFLKQDEDMPESLYCKLN